MAQMMAAQLSKNNNNNNLIQQTLIQQQQNPFQNGLIPSTVSTNNGYLLNGMIHYLPTIQQQQFPIDFNQTTNIISGTPIATNTNNFEGTPIFLLPNAGALSLTALQRATVYIYT